MEKSAIGTKDLVSIIIPVYNVETYLPKCLASIISQTYKSIEIVLINDGSTDSSLSICERYAECDHRIKLINQSNQGLSAARNAGLSAMKGEYFTFVDSDDYVDERYIESMMKSILMYKRDIVLAGITYEWPDHTSIEVPKEAGPIPSTEIIKMFALQKDGIIHTAWGKMFDRSLRDEIVFPVGKLYEDQFVMYGIILNHTCALINESTYHYRGREDSILNAKNNIAKKTNDMMESIQSLEKQIGQYMHELSEYINVKIAMDCLALIRFCIIGAVDGKPLKYGLIKIRNTNMKSLFHLGIDRSRILQVFLIKHFFPIYKRLLLTKNR